MSDDNDEYDEFFEMIKKYFGVNSEKFDVDFLFLPKSILDQNKDTKDKETRGFKVTYHFETGMDKPEIRIEGDLDQKKLQDYMKNYDLLKNSRFKKFTKAKSKTEIDASDLHLTPFKGMEEFKSIEPYSELNVENDHIVIIVEVPGVENGHILLSLSEDGKNLKISAKSKIKQFLKEIRLPFKSTMEDYSLLLNNGIATIKLKKTKK